MQHADTARPMTRSLPCERQTRRDEGCGHARHWIQVVPSLQPKSDPLRREAKLVEEHAHRGLEIARVQRHRGQRVGGEAVVPGESGGGARWRRPDAAVRAAEVQGGACRWEAAGPPRTQRTRAAGQAGRAMARRRRRRRRVRAGRAAPSVAAPLGTPARPRPWAAAGAAGCPTARARPRPCPCRGSCAAKGSQADVGVTTTLQAGGAGAARCERCAGQPLQGAGCESGPHPPASCVDA